MASRARRTKKKKEPVRMYGWFECPGCKNEWQSAYTWIRISNRGNEIPAFGQECRTRKCRGRYVMPCVWEPLKCPKCQQIVEECQCDWDDSDDSDMKKPHKAGLCEKCQSGNPCPRKQKQKQKQKQKSGNPGPREERQNFRKQGQGRDRDALV